MIFVQFLLSMRFVCSTLIGSQLTARHLEGLGDIATRHGLNIDNIRRLSGRVSIRKNDEQLRSCLAGSVSLGGIFNDDSESTSCSRMNSKWRTDD